jgi:hypothetical protein
MVRANVKTWAQIPVQWQKQKHIMEILALVSPPLNLGNGETDIMITVKIS